jgi:hypothetical protein
VLENFSAAVEDCGRAAQNKKGEKPMLPVDFVTVIPGTQVDEDSK